MNVSEIMTRQVAICREHDSLDDVVRRMSEADCGCVPVVGANGMREVVGIVTDRDVCMAAYRIGKPIAELRVRDAMTSPVRTCSADASASEAEYVMREARVRRLPVVDENGALVGIVSLADLAREAEHERRLSRPPISRIEIGATLAAICTPRSGARR
jgi:CBS domain-containing protein